MATLPGAYNFKAKAPRWSETITWKINDVAVNLTGYTPTLRVKFATGTTTYSTAQGVTVNASGQVSWDLDISQWATGFVDYDIKVVSGDGTTNWLLEGSIEVKP